MSKSNCAAAVVLLAMLSFAVAQGPPNPLAPKQATLKNSTTVQDALEQLREQTGNAVRDLRTTRTNPVLQLARTQGHFWPLLDEIGKAGGLGITPYGADGGVALLDGPYRAVPTAYSGLFRLALKRVAVDLDFETKSHLAKIRLDVAWEPRFQPFYLDVALQSVEYAPAPGMKIGTQATGTKLAHGQFAVAGRSATELDDLRLDAPPRGSPRITALRGKVLAIGPTRMLDFTFPKLAPITPDQKPIEQTQDGVTVKLTQLVAGRERWSIDVLIENPPGGPTFESYQSWLDNNKIALVRDENGKKVVWAPDATEEQQLGQVTAERAKIRYHFPIESGKRPGSLADWTLQYRTPGRIVQIEAPFEFRDVPLP